MKPKHRVVAGRGCRAAGGAQARAPQERWGEDDTLSHDCSHDEVLQCALHWHWGWRRRQGQPGHPGWGGGLGPSWEEGGEEQLPAPTLLVDFR